MPPLLEVADQPKVTKAFLAWTLVFGHFRNLKIFNVTSLFFSFVLGDPNVTRDPDHDPDCDGMLVHR